MNHHILDLLKNKQEKREWKDLLNSLHPVPIQYFKGEPVYEFFYNLDDDLEINSQPIVLSVNPYDSFVPFHRHNYVEMIIPMKGQVTIQIAEEIVELNEGELIIIGPNTIHRNFESSKENVVLNIALKSTAFSHTDLNFLHRSDSSSYLADLLFCAPTASEDENGIYTVFRVKPENGLLHTVANIVYEHYNIRDMQSSHIIRHELLVLFSKLLRISMRQDATMMSNRKEESKLLSLLLYIEKNYATLTLEEMGEHFGFNPNYLSTYLKKNTGKSFIKLIHLQRINAVADYLRYSNASIEKIALKVGYENPSYFYKIFKKTLGLSPAEYRENAKNI